MNKTKPKTGICSICGKEKAMDELLPNSLIKEAIVGFIKRDYPDWPEEGLICLEDYKTLGHEYELEEAGTPTEGLSDLEKEVIESIRSKQTLTRNVTEEFDEKLSVGDRLSDDIAKFGGSWKFIILFSSIIVAWIFLNVFILVTNPFDPYPFILLNLLLSCLAALQAPIIMMSQNRQEDKDRKRAEHDYQINMKAELEIRTQNEKIEQLSHDLETLLRIQDVQMEKLEDILNQENTK